MHKFTEFLKRGIYQMVIESVDDITLKVYTMHYIFDYDETETQRLIDSWGIEESKIFRTNITN